MKTFTIEKFRGLQVQANSFADNTGAMEKADNIVLSRDNIIQKRRGFRSEYYMPEAIYALADYSGYKWAIGANIYRLEGSATGSAAVAITSDCIVVRDAAHGFEDGYYLTDFLVDDDDFADAFPRTYSDYVGQNEITTEFDVIVQASGSATVVTQINHGLESGDTIDVLASDVGATGTALAVTVYDADTYTYGTAATGSGDATVQFLDAFCVTASNAATEAATGTASYQGYTMLTGDTFTVGEYVPVLRANKNLYWAAAEGIHAIESVSGPVRKAGIPPGLDVDAFLSGTSGGVASNSQAAYRVVFGRKDANGVVQLSAPSDTVLLSNQPTTLTTISFASGTGVLTITDANHVLSDGDLIYLYDVDSDDAPPDGSSIAVTGVSGTSFEIDLDDLGVSPSTVTEITYGTRKTATIYASLPAELEWSADVFYQVYRSESVDADVVPDGRFKLVEQVALEISDISVKLVTYEDALPLEVIESNQELYTNATQEGESQANARPPLASDIALFKNYVFYGDCTQYRTLALDLLQTTDLADEDTITIAGETYEFRGDAANESIGNDITTSSASQSGTTVTFTQVGHNCSDGDVIKVLTSDDAASPGTALVPVGNYTITVTGADTFTITVSFIATATGTVTYEPRYNSVSGYYIVTLTEPSDTAAETIAESVDFTARSIVKACNRNSTKLYANYASGITDSPGKILFSAQSLAEPTFAAIASSAEAGGCFSPTMPTSGTSLSDYQDAAENTLFVAKYLEPEAVPIVNRFPVGSQDAAILRIIALRDSLIVFKEDGVFRLNGDSPANFAVTALDTTVILKARRSVAVLNNSVYGLTNQGVVQVTDSAVRIISRPIEPLLTAVLGNASIDTYTAAVSYESERLYLLTTITPNTAPSTGNVVYCYNYLTDAWTSWDGPPIAYSGLVTSDTDKLLTVSAEDQKEIFGERKNQNKIDYTEQDIAMYLLRKRIANASTEVAIATVTIAATNHGINVGDAITITGASASLVAAFTNGADYINNTFLVTAVTDKVIQFEAAESAALTSTGTLFWNRSYQEAKVVLLAAEDTNRAWLYPFVSPLSVRDVLPVGQGIDVISVDTVTSIGGLPVLTDYIPAAELIGRKILRDDGTYFYFSTSTTNTGSPGAVCYAIISDRNGIDNVVTVYSAFQPQVGEAFVADERIYKIRAVEKFSSGIYICTLDSEVAFNSESLVYWHGAYNGRVRFAPITMGTGQLKQFAEFQCWFRHENSCSQVSINFATDSRYSDANTNWQNYVGTPEGFVTYGGWGTQAWGTFPWGGGSSVVLDYLTGPSVPLRTWLPQNSYLATFVQPELLHSVAGEPLEIQSIAIIGQPATQKVSK